MGGGAAGGGVCITKTKNAFMLNMFNARRHSTPYYGHGYVPLRCSGGGGRRLLTDVGVGGGGEGARNVVCSMIKWSAVKDCIKKLDRQVSFLVI